MVAWVVMVLWHLQQIHKCWFLQDKIFTHKRQWRWCYSTQLWKHSEIWPPHSVVNEGTPHLWQLTINMQSNFLHVNRMGKKLPTRANQPPTPGVSPTVDNCQYFLTMKLFATNHFYIHQNKLNLANSNVQFQKFSWGWHPGPTLRSGER